MQKNDPARELAHREAERRQATETLLRPNPTLERLKARSYGRSPAVAAAQPGPRQKPLVR